jgi:insertion element IS1 protein InsB
MRLKSLQASEIAVRIQKVEDAERDEMWSDVGHQKNQRWLWQAIDHAPGKILADVFGSRQDVVFLKRKELLEPFGITRFLTDDWGPMSVICPRNSMGLESEILKTSSANIEPCGHESNGSLERPSAFPSWRKCTIS